MPVIRMASDGQRELQSMKWGLVPSFTRLGPGERPDHYRMFNARCETLADKAVFSRLLQDRRCVVLLEGFYEWHAEGGKGPGGKAADRKQPYYITTAQTPQQPAMYMAGLYDVHRDASGDPLHSFTIITTDSSKPLEWLHDRMPVILTTDEEVAAWLGDRALPAAGKETDATHPQTAGSDAEHDGETHGSPPPSPSSTGGSGGRGGEGAAATPVAASEAAGEEAVSQAGGRGGGEGAATGEGHEPGAGSPHGAREARGQGGSGGGSGGKKGRGRGGARDEQARQEALALIAKICRPYGGPLLRWHPVTPDMGKPGYDKPDACVDVRTKKGSIASFFKPAAKPATPAAAGAAAQAPPPTDAKHALKQEVKQEGQQEPAVHGAVPVKEEVKREQVEAMQVAGPAIRNPDECEGAGGDASTAAAAQASPRPSPRSVPSPSKKRPGAAAGVAKKAGGTPKKKR